MLITLMLGFSSPLFDDCLQRKDEANQLVETYGVTPEFSLVILPLHGGVLYYAFLDRPSLEIS